MSKLLIDPHGDDAVLFASFLTMKEKPLVVVVLDSYIQVARGHAGATAERRRNETLAALLELGSPGQVFLGIRDDAPDWEYLRAWLKQRRDDGQFDGIICPAWEHGGHEQHNDIARICRDLWPDEQRTEYLTYTRTFGRSRAGDSTRGAMHDKAVEVIPTPDMVARKHRALACYTSQMEVPGCVEWFWKEDLREYVLPPAQSEGRGVDVGGIAR